MISSRRAVPTFRTTRVSFSITGGIEAETGVLVRTAVDSLLGADTAVRGAFAYAKTATDTLLGGDTATRAKGTFRSASDTLLGGDTVTRVKAGPRTAADTLLGADTAARVRISLRTTTDVLLGTDIATKTSGRARTAVDSLLGADTATRAVVSWVRSVSDALIGSDTATKTFVPQLRTATDTLLGGTSLVVTDSFDRANNASSLGSTDGGVVLPWTAVLGTWGISGNASYVSVSAPNPYDNYAVIDTGSSDGFVQAVIGTFSNAMGLVWRADNAGNFWTAQLSGTQVELYYYAAGSYNTVRNYFKGSFVPGDVLRIEFSGSNFIIKMNGISLGTRIDSRYQTATKIGMYGYTGDALVQRWNDFSTGQLSDVAVRTIPVPFQRTASDTLLGTDTAVKVVPGAARTAADTLLGTDTAVGVAAHFLGRTTTDALLGGGAVLTTTYVRTFNSTLSEKIDLALGAGASQNGSETFVAIVRRIDDSVSSYPIILGNNTTTERGLLLSSTSKAIGHRTGGNTALYAVPAQGPPILASDGWVLVAVSKVAGVSPQRFDWYRYRYSDGDWFAFGGNTTPADSTPSGSSAIGYRPSTPTPTASLDIAATGSWASVLTASEIQALALNLGLWFRNSPNGLWVLDQSSVAIPVLDRTGNGADQTSITGTSVTSVSPVPWSAEDRAVRSPLNFLRTAADSLIGNDVAVGVKTGAVLFTRTAADTLVGADTAVRSAQARQRTTTDSLIGADTAARVSTRARITADALLGADAAVRTALVRIRTAADALIGADTAVKGAPAPTRTAADTLLGADTAVRGAQAGVRTTTDVLLGADTASRIKIGPRTTTDFLLGADTATRSVARQRAASDSLLGADVASRVSARLRTATDSLIGADTATKGSPPPQRTTVDTLLGGDVAVRATGARLRTAVDSLLGADTAVRVGTRARTTVDVLLGADTAIRAARINIRAATDSLIGTDIAVTSTAHAQGRLATDTLLGADTATRISQRGKAVTDTLLGADTATRVSPRNRTAADTLLGADFASRGGAPIRLAFDSLIGGDVAIRTQFHLTGRTCSDALLGTDLATHPFMLYVRVTLDVLLGPDVAGGFTRTSQFKQQAAMLIWV